MPEWEEVAANLSLTRRTASRIGFLVVEAFIWLYVYAFLDEYINDDLNEGEPVVVHVSLGYQYAVYFVLPFGILALVYLLLFKEKLRSPTSVIILLTMIVDFYILAGVVLPQKLEALLQAQAFQRYPLPYEVADMKTLLPTILGSVGVVVVSTLATRAWKKSGRVSLHE